ncbi:helix-turn-helix domain-containing protein [Amazonocrinis nigriterrae]|uniref:helix-turn-helix domain-containing protein n=1 Tax=Amazonocrinis nigriterrae TaxID=2840443 RepID=UPI00298F0A39|nr:helix-turn-helix domain-containing protein [Amazonocrinis nigriterrae]
MIVTELSEEAQLKLEVIQSLLEPCDRTTYGQKLKEAAEKLGVTVRTVQRLVKKWEENGLVGFTQTGRADKGKLSHRCFQDTNLSQRQLKSHYDNNLSLMTNN